MSEHINMPEALSFSFNLLLSQASNGKIEFDYAKWSSFLINELRISDERVNKSIIKALIAGDYLISDGVKYIINIEKIFQEKERISNFYLQNKAAVNDYYIYNPLVPVTRMEYLFKGILYKLKEYGYTDIDTDAFIKKCQDSNVEVSITRMNRYFKELEKEGWLIAVLGRPYKYINIPTSAQTLNEMMNEYLPDDLKEIKSIVNLYTGQELYIMPGLFNGSR